LLSHGTARTLSDLSESRPHLTELYVRLWHTSRCADCTRDCPAGWLEGFPVPGCVAAGLPQCKKFRPALPKLRTIQTKQSRNPKWPVRLAGIRSGDRTHPTPHYRLPLRLRVIVPLYQQLIVCISSHGTGTSLCKPARTLHLPLQEVTFFRMGVDCILSKLGLAVRKCVPVHQHPFSR